MDITTHPDVTLGVPLVDHNGTLETVSFRVNRLTTLSQTGLTGAQAIAIEFSPDNGTTWEQARNGAEDMKMTVDDKQAVIIAPGNYRLTSGDTLVEVTVGKDVA